MLKFKNFKLQKGITIAIGATHVVTFKDNHKTAFTLAKIKGIFPLPGRGLSRGGDRNPHELANSPSIKFVSSHPFANKFFSLPRRDRRVAFTLAEVMIVVLIIGVVAALIMPSFIQDMSERINSNRQVNIAQKITKSVELMIASGDYKDITNTDEFVTALSKYLKISKRCDSEHIADCWPTRKIKTAKGEYYDVSNATTNKKLYVRGKDTTNNVGLVLADGASLILTFNPDTKTPSMEGGFSAYSKSLPIGGGKYKNFAYSSNATNAIDFIMDVNGGTGPNQEADLKGNYYDIRSFQVATFTPQACPGGTRMNGYCLVDIGTNYDAYDCYTRPQGATYCKEYFRNHSNNYWAGASIACEELGMKLPSRDEINNFKRSLNDWDFNKYWTTNTGFSAQINSYPHLNGGGSMVFDNVLTPALCVKQD